MTDKKPEKPIRQAISKRTRFEVFKRDMFCCQYCGSASPDVVLVVDHVVPVAEGGGRDLMNLITACRECNAGKAAIPLADTTAVAKQMKQVRSLAERREQMEMLVQWRDSLQGIEDDKVSILVSRIDRRISLIVPGSRINAGGRQTIAGWLKRFGFDACLRGIDGASENEDVDTLLLQMEQYSAAAAMVAKEPQLRDFWRIRTRMKGKRFRYGPEWKPITDMRLAFKDGVTIEEMDRAMDEATSYGEFRILIGFLHE